VNRVNNKTWGLACNIHWYHWSYRCQYKRREVILMKTWSSTFAWKPTDIPYRHLTCGVNTLGASNPCMKLVTTISSPRILKHHNMHKTWSVHSHLINIAHQIAKCFVGALDTTYGRNWEPRRVTLSRNTHTVTCNRRKVRMRANRGQSHVVVIVTHDKCLVFRLLILLHQVFGCHVLPCAHDHILIVQDGSHGSLKCVLQWFLHYTNRPDHAEPTMRWPRNEELHCSLPSCHASQKASVGTEGLPVKYQVSKHFHLVERQYNVGTACQWHCCFWETSMTQWGEHPI